MQDKITLYCNFCGHSQFEVEVLIAGPTVFICDSCVDLCDIIVKERRAENRMIEQIEREDAILDARKEQEIDDK